MNKESFLFLFTIGPVQSYISQARKTVDLYAGSRILSDLIGEAIKKLMTLHKNVDVIFPNISNDSKPNRFIAKVESISKEDIKKICNELETHIKNYFLDEMSKKIIRNINGTVDKTMINQLNSFLQVNWVAKELKDYKSDYSETEKLLGSIKNLRSFEQLEETGKKCSICGERNYLQIIDKNNLSEKEQLCSVCYSKRCYIDKHFPSTSEIALNFRELPKGHENEDYQIHFAKDLEEKYYAVIVFDGDSMGKWLSGENLENTDNIEKFHKDMSLKLGDYAKWAKDYLKESSKNGVSVYAGGDDFLGFITLTSLFEVMNTLRINFDEMVNKQLKETSINYKIKKDANFTFSAGIVIAHHKEPLGEVLKWARKMEHEAKNNDKDSFALAVLKHSGEIHKTVYKWNNGIDNNIDLMKNIFEKLNNKEYSTTFIKILETEFLKLIDIKDDSEKFKDDIKEIFFTEIKRTLKRANIKKDNFDIMEDNLKRLYVNSKNISNFFDMLNIIEFLHRKMNKEE